MEWARDRFFKLVEKLFEERLKYDERPASLDLRAKDFVEFTYSFFVKNFGMGAVAEKRLMDFFVNCKLHQGTETKVALLCSFTHILEPCYSMDCFAVYTIMQHGLKSREMYFVENEITELRPQMELVLTEDFHFLKPELRNPLVRAIALGCAESTPSALSVMVQLMSAWSLASEAQVWSRLEYFFAMVDTEGKGTLAVDQFRILMRIFDLGAEMDDKTVSQIFQSGEVNLDTFVEIIQIYAAHKGYLNMIISLFYGLSRMKVSEFKEWILQQVNENLSAKAPARRATMSRTLLFRPLGSLDLLLPQVMTRVEEVFPLFKSGGSPVTRSATFSSVPSVASVPTLPSLSSVPTITMEGPSLSSDSGFSLPPRPAVVAAAPPEVEVPQPSAPEPELTVVIEPPEPPEQPPLAVVDSTTPEQPSAKPLLAEQPLLTNAASEELSNVDDNTVIAEAQEFEISPGDEATSTTEAGRPEEDVVVPASTPSIPVVPRFSIQLEVATTNSGGDSSPVTSPSLKQALSLMAPVIEIQMPTPHHGPRDVGFGQD